MRPETPPTKELGTYASLQPHDVLSALDAVGLRGDGRLLQLNSYENRVFQVFLESGEAVVTKFYRPGRWSQEQILEEHSFALELQAEEVPVVAPLTLEAADLTHATVTGPHATLATWAQGPNHWRFAVSPRQSGRAPEIDDAETLRWIGRFVARLHAVGARRTFAHRRTMDVAVWGWANRQWLLENGVVTPAERAAWEDASARALAVADEAFSAAGPIQHLRLHGDAHPGNILWREEGPHVVDLDDACNGPAVQDLWMLLPGDEEGRARSLRLLLEGYETVRDFDDAELALIEPLRTMRMIQHSAWIAQRWSDPAFPSAFPYFGTPAYWSEQTTQLREQVGV